MTNAKNAKCKQHEILPQGFEYKESDGRQIHVRQRRSVAGNDLIGISLHIISSGKVESIERIDVAPSLRGMNRSAVQSMLSEAFSMLNREEERTLAHTRIEKLVGEGLCARCVLSSVKQA